MDATLIRRVVEAALFASPQPLSLAQLAALFPEDSALAPGSLQQAIGELIEQNGQRGVRLIEVASGFRFQVDSALQPWVARLWTERPPRYSRALLETLALIAYRQPITRGEIEQIRGVAVSTHIIKTMEEREWIRVVGHRDVPGRPALFGTTRGFLDYFGLKALDELPPLTELQDLPDLEPELPLDGILSREGGASLVVEATADSDEGSPAAADALIPGEDETAQHVVQPDPESSPEASEAAEAAAILAPGSDPPEQQEREDDAAPSTSTNAAVAARFAEDPDAAAEAGSTPDTSETQADDDVEPEQTP
jgi:segregation and condensation protein B